jgi:hypothetical protein
VLATSEQIAGSGAANATPALAAREGVMKMKTWAMTDLVRLRPIEESELADLLRCYWDLEVTGEFQWFGFRLGRC